MDLKFIVSAALAACVVAGCSSDSSTSTADSGGEPPPPPPTPTHAVALPDDTGMLEAGMLTVAAGMSQTVNGFIFSCDAGGMDCDIELKENLGALMATSTGGMATVAAVHVEPEPMPDTHTVALPADTGMLKKGTLTVTAGMSETVNGFVFSCTAGGMDCAIEIVDNLGTLMATSTGGMATVMAVEIPAPPMGYMAMNSADMPIDSVTIDSSLPDDDVKINADRIVATITGSDDAPMLNVMIGDHTEHLMLSEDSDTGMRMASFDVAGRRDMLHVDLYTDVDDPTMMKVKDTVTGGSSYRVTSDGERTRIVPRSQIQIQLKDTDVNKRMVTLEKMDGTENNHVREGSWNGIPGEFICGADKCTITAFNDDLYIEAMGSGNLRFRPGKDKPGGDDVEVYAVSTDYLAIGTWLRVMDTGVAKMSGFHLGDMRFEMPDDEDMMPSGEATYSGASVGRYWGMEDGSPMAGKFTAEATLKANFGEKEIGGDVDHFMLDDGTAVNWLIELDDTMVNDNGSFKASTGSGSFAMGMDVTGHWSGRFYGEAAVAGASLLGDATDPCKNCPSSAAGMFDAQHKDVGIVGAFAAYK